MTLTFKVRVRDGCMHGFAQVGPSPSAALLLKLTKAAHSDQHLVHSLLSLNLTAV